MPDRGGGREPKGASLKVTKKNPGGVAARGMKKKVVLSPESKPNLPPPPPRSGKFFDCSTAILSRQFDRDRDRVLSRASADGVSGILCWFADIEKLDELAALCAANSGFCYYIAGVHPDNIDRTNKKHEGWMAKVDDSARNAECVAILSGLNFNREIGTHFAQESLLRASYKLAVSLNLPLVLHVLDPRSLERAIEVLLEEGYTNDHKIILHDFITCARVDMSLISSTVQHDFYYSLSAHPLLFEGCDVSALGQLPLSRMLLCSNAPWNTPQNIPDSYIRSQRNESSNISFVVDILYDMLVTPHCNDVPKAVFAQQLYDNAMHVFKLSNDEQHDEHNEVLKMSPPSEVAKEAPVVSAEESVVAAVQPMAAAGSYACNKCRVPLFSADTLMSHDMATVFNKGAEGTCNAVLYISNEHEIPAFNVNKDIVSCGKCQAKIGKYVPHEVQCPCGAMICGPLYRIITSKVDYIDLTARTQELAQRSAEEMTTIFSEMELSAQEEKERSMQLKQQKKSTKKKKLKSENKGNFSDYRNKSFIPNASRKASAPALAESATRTGDDSSDSDSST